MPPKKKKEETEVLGAMRAARFGRVKNDLSMGFVGEFSCRHRRKLLGASWRTQDTEAKHYCRLLPTLISLPIFSRLYLSLTDLCMPNNNQKQAFPMLASRL